MIDAMRIENVEIGGRAGQGLTILGGRIATLGREASRALPVLDGGGGALIPGLADHHLHLFATAARAASIDLTGADRAEVARRIAGAPVAAGEWIRAVGYHEQGGGLLTRDELDAMAPRNPLRVQHQTGELWLLNSPALALTTAHSLPPMVECDRHGRPTGRIWRGDAWLGERIGRVTPGFRAIGDKLSAFGVTAVTDASPTTDASGAAVLAEARRRGDLPQRLMLMSGGPLAAPVDGAFAVGPVKILLDDERLPTLDELAALIANAHDQDRGAAIHCVTEVQLAISLAALDQAGCGPRDRIEHASLVPPSAIMEIRRLGVTVVTQPDFVRSRGDRYRDHVEREDQDNLYRLGSLEAAGVPVAASSDAPYGTLDPWASMRAAVYRKTARAESLGAAEALSPASAMRLFLGHAARPGHPRRIVAGAAADLCLLSRPMRDVLGHLDADLVAATIVAGSVTYLQ